MIESVSSQMGGAAKSCVYHILSSFGHWGKRETGAEMDLSACVCNDTYTGEACCYAQNGMVYLD